MKDKKWKETGLGKDSLYHSTRLTMSWPTQHELQSKLLVRGVLHRAETGSETQLYSVTNWWLPQKSVSSSQKPEKDPKNINS